MDVLACGFLVADIVVAGLERIAAPGEVVVAPRGIVLSVGGHPANVAIDLVKLGLEPDSVGVCGTVGNDIFGEFIERVLASYGVRLFIERVKAPTNKNVILVVKGEDRRFHVELGASNLLRPELIEELVEREKPRIFYLASGITELVDKRVGEVFKTAKLTGSLTFADLASSGKSLDYLVPAMPYIDVLHCNDAEARLLTGEGNAAGAARRLNDMGVKTALVTMGERGALAATSRFLLKQPAFRVEVVDPTGAGDAFCAGVILGLLERGWRSEELARCDWSDVAQLLLLGQAAGAAACTAPGTTEGVLREKVEALIREQGADLLRATSLESR
ncbi:MAG: carbohydrate kinase family protein [Thermofilaceae archaeon]